MSKNTQDYDSIVRDLVADNDDILGAVILYKQLPITQLIGKLNKTEILKIADKIIEFHQSINRLPSLVNNEKIFMESRDTLLIVVFYPNQCLLLVKAKQTDIVGRILHAIEETSQKIQSLLDPRGAYRNSYQLLSQAKDNEIKYRKKPLSPEF
ncbi:MAG: hypothetical protein F6K63_21465 [Moorea sp. SIO1G6]|uniref:Roadblock/LAMTOR2 domain-containing protein n=2 Tax=Coleofasciculaceae TaxID=1892251 RepID=F4XX00_9CYAN|nr:MULTISPECIES: hypothetical protein [Moorena]NEP64848.1 hypothetical protein [Moorena sp. SIO3A5]NEQ09089.1 hypothetical protein [Moorena sp. SIO4E2]NEQ13704.1 hypothetical protein [Moorena sp. SIO3E2]NER87489.1 hypothetical protein [Moorena sp. SIO3A2]EGJ30885.1 hypothetical protein LYNGBM3L_45750 [Moorena producens 3L]